MTKSCINTLKELRRDDRFRRLSLEQLLYEALNSNQWDKEELTYIIDSLIEEKEELLKMEA